MVLQLGGRRAPVTGGSRGIGKAVARILAEGGVDVVIAARSREALQATEAELTAAAGRRIGRGRHGRCWTMSTSR